MNRLYERLMTTIRGFRISDELYEQASAVAKKHNTDLSAVVRDLLGRYLKWDAALAVKPSSESTDWKWVAQHSVAHHYFEVQYPNGCPIHMCDVGWLKVAK